MTTTTRTAAPLVSNPFDLVRLDAALVKGAAWNGFCKARVLFGKAISSQHARPVFGALGCDNLRNAR